MFYERRNNGILAGLSEDYPGTGTTTAPAPTPSTPRPTSSSSGAAQSRPSSPVFMQARYPSSSQSPAPAPKPAAPLPYLPSSYSSDASSPIPKGKGVTITEAAQASLNLRNERLRKNAEAVRSADTAVSRWDVGSSIRPYTENYQGIMDVTKAGLVLSAIPGFTNRAIAVGRPVVPYLTQKVGHKAAKAGARGQIGGDRTSRSVFDAANIWFKAEGGQAAAATGKFFSNAPEAAKGMVYFESPSGKTYGTGLTEKLGGKKYLESAGAAIGEKFSPISRWVANTRAFKYASTFDRSINAIKTVGSWGSKVAEGLKHPIFGALSIAIDSARIADASASANDAMDESERSQRLDRARTKLNVSRLPEQDRKELAETNRLRSVASGYERRENEIGREVSSMKQKLPFAGDVERFKLQREIAKKTAELSRVNALKEDAAQRAGASRK